MTTINSPVDGNDFDEEDDIDEEEFFGDEDEEDW